MITPGRPAIYRGHVAARIIAVRHIILVDVNDVYLVYAMVLSDAEVT
jgi:hypothetical protein